MKRYFEIFSRVVRREWAFLLKDTPKFLIFNTIFPIFSFFVVIGIFNTPTLHKLPIAVLDNDKSVISQELITNLNASPELSLYKMVNSADEAKRLLSSAKIYGFVIIPKDFSKQVLGYKGANVPVYYNEQFIIMGGIVSKGAVTAIKAFSDKYNVTYEESGGVPIYAAVSASAPVLFNNITLFNPWLNYQYFMLSGLLPAIFQLFAIGAFVYSFGHEFRHFRAKEIKSKAEFAPMLTLVGKSLPYLMIYLVIAAVMIFLLFWYIKMPLEAGGGKVLLATLLFTLGSCFSGVFIICLARGNLRMSLSVMAVYAAPAFAYAGVTFPYIAMPFFAKMWSELLPITHYHRILVNEAIRGAPVSSTTSDMLYLFIFAFVTFSLSVYLYREIIRREELWGKL